MQLEHERRDAYDFSLQFLVLVNGIIEVCRGVKRGTGTGTFTTSP